MRSQDLLNLYLIKLIHPKLFTIVFSYSTLLLKKNGDSILLLQSLYLAGLFLILTMTTSMLGSSSCYTKMKIWLIPDLLILIKISILTYLFGSPIGGHNLALLLIFFQDLWLAPSSILQVFTKQIHMVLSFLLNLEMVVCKGRGCPYLAMVC